MLVPMYAVQEAGGVDELLGCTFFRLTTFKSIQVTRTSTLVRAAQGAGVTWWSRVVTRPPLSRSNIANFEAWPYVETFNSLPVLASRLKETSFPRQAPILLDVVNRDVEARRPISPTLLGFSPFTFVLPCHSF